MYSVLFLLNLLEGQMIMEEICFVATSQGEEPNNEVTTVWIRKKTKKLTDWGRTSQCFLLCCMGSWHQTRISWTALALQGKLNSSRDTRVESIVIKLLHAITLSMLKHTKWSFELLHHLKEIGGEKKIHIYTITVMDISLPGTDFTFVYFPVHVFLCYITLLTQYQDCPYVFFWHFTIVPLLFFFFNWKGLGKLFLNFRTECEFVFRVRTIEVLLFLAVVFPFAQRHHIER